VCMLQMLMFLKRPHAPAASTCCEQGGDQRKRTPASSNAGLRFSALKSRPAHGGAASRLACSKGVPNLAHQLVAVLEQSTVLLLLDLRRRGVPPVLRYGPPDALDPLRTLRPRAESTVKPL
jgi:hypothetical protein